MPSLWQEEALEEAYSSSGKQIPDYTGPRKVALTLVRHVVSDVNLMQLYHNTYAWPFLCWATLVNKVSSAKILSAEQQNGAEENF